MRGREEEIRISQELLRSAQQGTGRVFLIEGEPGIGKSELLGEIAKFAVSQGFSVASARADELGALMPFSLLLAAFNDPLDGAVMEDARTRAIEEITRAVNLRTAASPLLVSLDDLQWADQATLHALRLLMRQFAAYPLVWNLARCTTTQRGDASMLFDLLHGEGATRVSLAPLGTDAVAGMITDELDAVPDEALTELASGAAGNPALLRALLRGLHEEDGVQVTKGAAALTAERLPQRLTRLARQRLDAAGGPARHLLETAAVIGASFRLEDLAGMLGQTPAALLPVLIEAVESGVLAASPDAFVFRHELIWRAMTEIVPLPARQALHRQFGEILLSQGGAAMLAAEHLLQGSSSGDPAVITSLDTAAEEILGSAPASAADLAVRALELTPVTDPAWFTRTMRAADALASAARLDKASALVRETLAQPQPAEIDAQLRAVLASVLCMEGLPAEASGEAESVLATRYLTGPLRDEAIIAQLHALIALGRNQRARDAAEDVLAAFGDHGQPALAGAMSVLAAVSWDEGRLPQGLHLFREAVRRTAGISPDARHFQPLLALASRLIDLRQLDEAVEIINAASTRIQVLNSDASAAIPGILRARVELAMGRMDDARAEAEVALGVADAQGARTHSSLALVMLSVIALRGGDLRTAGLHIRSRPDVSHYTDSYARTETLLAKAQFVEAAAGPETAMPLLDEVYAGLPAHRHVLVGEPTASAWLARTALAAGRQELATGVARVADEIARDNPALEMVTVAAAHCGGLVSRDPALLAHAAAGHRDPWARASAAEDLGNVLAETYADDAIVHLDEALEGYSQTGAARDLARVRRRLRRLGVRRRHWVSAERPANGWASLTETEAVTASLVAQGLSNGQVADRMYLSVHTVAFHLRQVFRKLGISSRVELARLVAEQAGDDGDSHEHPGGQQREQGEAESPAFGASLPRGKDGRGEHGRERGRWRGRG
jgi:DNA-binding CsgD family transcriptional regulator